MPSPTDKELTYVMGKFSPNTHADFERIEATLTSRTMYIRKEAHKDLKRMYEAALAATGIKIVVVSATRNFDAQKGIWERKWTENAAISDPVARTRKILEFSSMPGSSRHHWGTDVDILGITDANPTIPPLTDAYFQTESGKKLYKWLQENAGKYGFCQPYTSGRPTGYFEEKWHWSYTPLSKGFTEFAKLNLKNTHISGFSGSGTAVEIDILRNYVLGINKGCQ